MSLPSASIEVVVAGGGEVGDPFGDDFVDRDRDRAVLEEGLFEVADVVDDHRRAPAAASALMLSAKAVSPLKAVAKAIAAPGREVVDDLGHRPALVGRLRRRQESSRTPTGVGEAAGVAGPGQVAAGDVAGGVGRARWRRGRRSRRGCRR